MHKFAMPIVLSASAFAVLSFVPLPFFDIDTEEVVLAIESKSGEMIGGNSDSSVTTKADAIDIRPVSILSRY